MDKFDHRYIPIIRKMIPHLVGGPLEGAPVDWTEDELSLIEKLKLDNSGGCDTLKE